MGNVLLLAVCAALLAYWWDTMRCKEIARQAGIAACKQAQVQFLDDTVQHKKVWLRRNERGRLQLCRLFIFEFASDGVYRYSGRIVMLGARVQDVAMDAYRLQ